MENRPENRAEISGNKRILNIKDIQNRPAIKVFKLCKPLMKEIDFIEEISNTLT